MKSSGQLFGGEFLASYMVFLAALVVVLYLWNSNLREIDDAERQQQMNNIAVEATEQLLRTSGSPTNWTLSNFSVLGLANESRVLEKEKVKDFMLLMSYENTSLCTGSPNYECNRHLLGLGTYDFSLNMTYLNGSMVMINSTMCFAGRNPENDTYRITVTRTALVEGELVKVHFTMWAK